MKKSRRQTDAISGGNAKKTSRFGNLGCALFSLPFFLGGAAITLHQKHNGNLRDALREMYDLYANKTMSG